MSVKKRMEWADSKASIESTNRNSVSALGAETLFQNMLKNIYEVYQLMYFRCIMKIYRTGSLSFVMIVQIHYTSESPVRLFYIKKVVKWCKNKIFIKNPDIPKPPDHLRRFIILTIWHISFLLISCTRTSYILFTHYYFTLSWCRKYKSGSKHTSSDL